MATIKIPFPLRPYVGNLSEVQVEGSTVGGALDDMLGKYPSFRHHLVNENRSLRAFVNLFLNGQNIKDLQGLNTPVNSDDIINLIPSIAGG